MCKKLTDKDRGLIIWHHLRNWKRMSKQDLTLALGLSKMQVAGVIAHCHENLGGMDYALNYVKDRPTGYFSDDPKSKKSYWKIN
jgi:hypothetical protein